LFCSHCGGKVVDGKLTLKGTWQEFVGPFFSWDNNFWKTQRDLLLKPEAVLNAYISGARQKYFKPFPYILLYATIALLAYKLFPFSEMVDLEGMTESMSSTVEAKAIQLQFYDDLDRFYKGYYNLATLLFVPLFAVVTFLSFRKRGNNFSEHLVFQCYVQGFGGFVTVTTQLLFFNLLGFDSVYYLYFGSVFLYVYLLYVLYRLYRLTIKSFLLALLRLGLYGGIMYFLLVVALVVFYGVTKM
jgi:hypothetical protein